jgi:hypothetical protein
VSKAANGPSYQRGMAYSRTGMRELRGPADTALLSTYP